MPQLKCETCGQWFPDYELQCPYCDTPAEGFVFTPDQDWGTPSPDVPFDDPFTA